MSIPRRRRSVGIPVERVRWLAVLGGGALASLGGAYLALDQHQFTDSMTAGRGFIALAAIIFGNWQPRRVAVACLLFAAAETLQIQLQGLQLVPSQFVEMIPYALTIVALAGLVGRAVPPRPSAAPETDVAIQIDFAQGIESPVVRAAVGVIALGLLYILAQEVRKIPPKLFALMATAFIDMVGLLMIIPLLPFYVPSSGRAACRSSAPRSGSACCQG